MSALEPLPFHPRPSAAPMPSGVRGVLARAMDRVGRRPAPLVLTPDQRVFDDPASHDLPAAPPRPGALDLAFARHVARRVDVDDALAWRAVPFGRAGGATLVATDRPDAADALARRLAGRLGPVRLARIETPRLDAWIAEVHGTALARRAECRPPQDDSCRPARAGRAPWILGLSACTLLGAVLAAPRTAIAAITALALLTVVANLSLRLAALIALRRPARPRPRPDGPMALWPSISMMVPLHREPQIVPRLLERLAALDYPAARREVLLVVEADDDVTRAALDAARLPDGVRVVPVPDGHPRTKPRALNYALNFAVGDIVGVWDAEDAPAPDQLRRVAAHFRSAAPDVACLQGRLDFYNATHNWIARCFTIEYAMWFRLVLPGLVRMGLVIPLGGTTLFFRRDALEAVGAWDAHNVTEDADLGLRLARRGWRTEIVDTTTLEEANAAARAWINQRSRWLKGYALTWAIHMRRPVRLWRDLGAWRFAGVQLLFLGALMGAASTPALFGLALIPFGLDHPILDWLPADGGRAFGAAVVTLTGLQMLVAYAACAHRRHKRLRFWIPTLDAYFALATFALAKGLWEIAAKPFHWDKTTHGAFGGAAPSPASPGRASQDAAMPTPA